MEIWCSRTSRHVVAVQHQTIQWFRRLQIGLQSVGYVSKESVGQHSKSKAIHAWMISPYHVDNWWCKSADVRQRQSRLLTLMSTLVLISSCKLACMPIFLCSGCVSRCHVWLIMHVTLDVRCRCNWLWCQSSHEMQHVVDFISQVVAFSFNLSEVWCHVDISLNLVDWILQWLR